MSLPPLLSRAAPSQPPLVRPLAGWGQIPSGAGGTRGIIASESQSPGERPWVEAVLGRVCPAGFQLFCESVPFLPQPSTSNLGDTPLSELRGI